MKADTVKKQLVKQLVKSVVVLAILGSGLFVAFTLKSDTEAELQKVSQEASNIDKQAQSLKMEYDRFETINKAYYEQVPQNKRENDKLASAVERIKVARPIIESLKALYQFDQLDITFSPVEADEKNYDTKNVRVMSNKVIVDFGAASDELVLSFLDSLITELPGYIQLETFDINREQDITQDVLNRIGQNKEAVSLVTGRMTFLWKTLMSVEEEGKEPDKGTSGNPMDFM